VPRALAQSVLACRAMLKMTLGSFVVRTVLRFAGVAACSAALLGSAGCSRGGMDSPDPDTQDLAMPEVRPDLSAPDLGVFPDLAAVSTCAAPCWLNPLPQGNHLRAVWRDASGDGWAVGSSSSMLRLQGGRVSLVRDVTSDKSNSFFGVWGSSQSDVWAVGSKVVLHYDGKTWSPVTLDTGGYLGQSAVWGTGPKDVWIVGYTGTIAHYDGTTWKSVPSGTTKSLVSVHGTSDKQAIAVGESGTILRWDGTAWRTAAPLTLSSLARVRCASATDCLAVGDGGTVLGWDGSKWTVLKITGASANLLGLIALGPNHYMLTGYSAEGLRAYRSDGKTVNEITTDGEDLIDLAGPSEADITAVGNGGAIAHYNGLSWTRLSAGSNETLVATWGTSATDLWITGAGRRSFGHLNRWDGKTLTPYEAPSRTNYKAIWGSSASSVWAVGYQGYMAHWDGTRWSAEPKLTTSDFYAIHGSGPTQVWAAAGSGELLRYDGAAWTVQPSLGKYYVLGLWLASASDGWAVGRDEAVKGVLFRFDGSKWTLWPKQLDQPVSLVWGSGPKDVWAGGSKGQLAHFDGTQWTQVTSPTTSEVTGLGGSGPADVWLVTYGGTAHHFDGGTWHEVATDNKQTLNTVWVGGSQVLAGGQDGTLLRLTP
jgi:hypothetical protein